MKLLQFAVASIVDANTGYANFNYEYAHNSHNIGYKTEIQNGRNIRSRTIVNFFRSITQRIATSVDRYQVRVQQKRNINQLYQLNSHLLRDIGLTNEDLGSVARGEVSLEQLNGKRQGDSVVKDKQVIVQGIAFDHTLSASNQKDFREVKCA